MTTILPITAGPLKGEIVAMAYDEIGIAGTEFDRSADETIVALRRLDALMLDWKAQGIDLGYVAPDYGAGNAGDASGILPADMNTVALGLAIRLAPTIGQQISTETRGAFARSFALLQARYATIPERAMPRGTARGAGNSWYRRWFR